MNAELNSIAFLRLCDASESFVKKEYGYDVDRAELHEFLRETLHGPRGIWAPSTAGLVTDREVARFIADHLYRWVLKKRPGQRWDATSVSEGDALVDALERAIFGETQ